MLFLNLPDANDVVLIRQLQSLCFYKIETSDFLPIISTVNNLSTHMLFLNLHDANGVVLIRQLQSPLLFIKLKLQIMYPLCKL
jgi:hypothetical protein